MKDIEIYKRSSGTRYTNSYSSNYGDNSNYNSSYVSSHSTYDDDRKLLEELCANEYTSIPCGECVYSIGSQYFLRHVTFQQLIGLMESILKPVSGSTSSVRYKDCQVHCNGYTKTGTKVVKDDAKVICDTAFCKYLLSEWIGVNGTNKVHYSRITELTEIIQSTTNTSGLITSLGILLNNYQIWQPATRLIA